MIVADGLEVTLIVLLLLFLVALIAGFIDTLVGGGGLLTIPALLAAGVPPLMALGTNKLQSVGGSGTASISLWLKRQYTIRDIGWWVASAFFGSILGTILVQSIDSDTLSFIVPCVIVIIAAYFILAPRPAQFVSEPKVSRTVYGSTAVPIIGTYDGMFGPGTGSFFVLAGAALRGQDIVTATKYAKPLNFATNLASLCVFIYYAKVLWTIGLVMMLGQFLGARMGANRLMIIDPSVLRYLVIGLCSVMLLTLLW